MNGQLKYNLLALFTVIVWGTTFVSTKILLADGLTPSWIFISRFAIAYLCILSLCYKRLWSDSVKDELFMLALGLTGGSLYFIMENTALQYTFASNVSLIICAAPILTMSLNALIFKQRFTFKAAIGSVFALFGVVIVVLNGSLNFGLNPLGDCLTLLAALLWAIYCMLLKYMNRHYSNLFITRKVFFYGLSTALLFCIFEPLPDIVSPVPIFRIVANLLFLGIIASFLCYLIWNQAVKVLGPNRTANYIYFSPFITIVSSSIILDEPVTLSLIAGGAIIISGVYLTSDSHGN